jgi:nucleotide-binding universal stress UspA family protein
VKGYTTIVVPLDGSVQAETAIDHAVRVAVAGSTLHLFRVVDLVAPNYLPEGTDRESLWAEQIEPAEQYLALIASRLEAATLTVITKVGSGSAQRAICDYARAIDADLIAMTTHGRSGLGQLLLGSVASDVVRDCGRPVLLIRPVELA